jgi:hypothetical protein
MRKSKDAPFAIRPLATIIGTTAQAALAISFLIIWSDPAAVNIGIWERVVAVSQAAYATWVVVSIYLVQQRKANLLTPNS